MQDAAKSAGLLRDGYTWVVDADIRAISTPSIQSD
jgi:hypothetical protein